MSTPGQSFEDAVRAANPSFERELHAAAAVLASMSPPERGREIAWTMLHVMKDWHVVVEMEKDFPVPEELALSDEDYRRLRVERIALRTGIDVLMGLGER